MNTTTYTTRYDETLALTYATGTYYAETETMHTVKATQDGELIGELYADLATGQIMQVEVNEDRRGEGIARALVAFASEHFEVFHSPDEHCTAEGLAFKEALDDIETINEALAYNPEA